MHFIRLTNSTDSIYSKAMELYCSSFPYNEQRGPDIQINIMEHPQYRFNLIYDGNIWVGLMLCWENEQFIYIEHFCILPEMRNKHYGERSLELLQKSGKKLILEIDPPVNEISVRRKVFYERALFCDNSFEHIHPPYHEGYHGHPLVVMSYPNKLNNTEYGEFYKYLCCIMNEGQLH